MQCPLEKIFNDMESPGSNDDAEIDENLKSPGSDCDEIDGIFSGSNDDAKIDENLESPGSDCDGIDGTSAVFSPGTQSYVTKCDASVKIYVGQKFKSLKEGIQFYRNYAAKCGFDVRLGSHKRFRDGSMKSKQVYCNRQGYKYVSCEKEDTNICPVKKRKGRVSKRVGCEARVVFKSCGNDGYYVSCFDEEHCHMLVSDVYKEFCKGNRNLQIAHKQFILNCARANIGATKSYRLFKEFSGGYGNIGCTKVDFKNFARDMKAYVAGADVQMLLNKLYMRKESSPGFIFEYYVDEKDQLKSLFWTDAICRRNYGAFGDVVSFDAAYSTNRYNMIFCPFTGKDNHGTCVTFGVGLLSRENVEAFCWLFEKFKDCMGRSPNMIITEQDPVMKIAIERVLIDTLQRPCMWHILKKLPDNLPSHLKKDPSFKAKLKNVVYSNYIESLEFVGLWDQVMSEFGLTDNVWFKSLFAIRENWIPAYFRDLPMSGLFRTTSLSESENGFFSMYANPQANLVEFFMNVESALDTQRRNLNEINGADEHRGFNNETQLPIEKHAAVIYTSAIFSVVQGAISSACFTFRIVDMNTNDNMIYKEVDDRVNGVFKVVYDNVEDSFVCGCKRFVRDGLLCSHIFYLLKDMKLGKNPEKYVVSRWTKFVYKNCIVDGSGVLNGQCNLDERTLLLNQILSEFYACLGQVEGRVESMTGFLCAIKQFKESLFVDECHEKNVSGNKKIFDEFYGSSIPDHIVVFPPEVVKNKGSGSRLKSRKEAAIKRSNKPLRMCSVCEIKSTHDARNCPKKVKKDAAAAAATATTSVAE